MYDNGMIKMINYIYEDFVADGDFEDTKKLISLMDEVDKIIEDENIKDLVGRYNFETSRQFFILGFLKAIDIFSVDLQPLKKSLWYVGSLSKGSSSDLSPKVKEQKVQ